MAEEYVRCSRDTLRRAIHDKDPINTSLRWNAKIVRRSFSVPGPNSLWHIGNVLNIIYFTVFS